VHVTLRRAKGLPSLRSEALHQQLREAIRATRRDDFRIVHYSVQADHVHMIVEAENRVALGAGMKSFKVRATRRMNTRVLRRRGPVWGDRYHRRDLPSPSEVRNALVYVINNHYKHDEPEGGLIDTCSSGAWFDGWTYVLARPPDPSPTAAPQTWLLDGGWSRTLPLIRPGELPRTAR
jgi:putative transposase